MEYQEIKEYIIVDAYEVQDYLEEAKFGGWYLHGPPFECNGQIFQALVCVG